MGGGVCGVRSVVGWSVNFSLNMGNMAAVQRVCPDAVLSLIKNENIGRTGGEVTWFPLDEPGSTLTHGVTRRYDQH